VEKIAVYNGNKPSFYLFVFLLLIFCPAAFAVDKIFDNGEPLNNYWRSPANWNPDSIPISSEDAKIYAGFVCEINDPDAVGGGDGAAYHIYVYNGATLNMTGGIVNTDSTLVVGKDSSTSDAGSFNMSSGIFNAAAFVIGQGTTSNGVVNLSGDALFNVPGWMVLSQSAGAQVLLRLSDNAILTRLSAVGHMIIGQYDTSRLEITDNAVVNATENNVLLGYAAGGDGIIEMRGGTFNIANRLIVGTDPNGAGTVLLYDGTLTAGDMDMYVGRSSMDITRGSLVLDGNDVPVLNGYIDANLITAYNNQPGGDLNVYYDAGQNTTTLTATDPNFGYIARSPTPADRLDDVPTDIILSWAAPVLTPEPDGYNVYFGTDPNNLDIVTNPPQPQTAAIYDTADLSFDLLWGSDYFWQIEVIDGVQTWPGNVWKFTTECPPADLDGNCFVDLRDLAIMAREWNP